MTTLDPPNPESADSMKTTEEGARIVGVGVGEGPGPDVMAASTLIGNRVVTADGDHVGRISDIMLDVRSGRIAYAMLSSGSFFGLSDGVHAIPWSALTLDTDDKCFVLDAPVVSAGR